MPTTTALTVTSTERLSPGMVRVHFRSNDLSAFADSPHTDRYVKLVFGGDTDGEHPALRTYTAIDPDVAVGTVAIDFVIHGDEGVAGPWAARARPGQTLTARGPGGGYVPDPSADWHLLAGDASALPAIAAALEAMPTDAVGHVVIEVADHEHESPLRAPVGVEVTWVHNGQGAGRQAGEPGEHESSLVNAVRALPWRPGRVHAFVHGEAQTVMHGIRPYLLKERGVRRADASISGYWRRGRSEEAFREWKSQLSKTEAASA